MALSLTNVHIIYAISFLYNIRVLMLLLDTSEHGLLVRIFNISYFLMLENAFHIVGSGRWTLWGITLKTLSSISPSKYGYFEVVKSYPLCTTLDLQLYFLFVFVLMGWSLLPNALRPFQIYYAPPNLGITRTWIYRLNFAQRPIFSGLRFFNEPEISDWGPPD